MRALGFITGHVIFKLGYNQTYLLKTTQVSKHKISDRVLEIPCQFHHLLEIWDSMDHKKLILLVLVGPSIFLDLKIST